MPFAVRPPGLRLAHHQRAARQHGGTAARGVGGAVQHRLDRLDAVRGRDRRAQRVGGEIADIMVGKAVAPGPAARQVEQREAFAEQ